MKKLGDAVAAGEVLYRVHARFEADLGFARALADADGGYRIGAAGEPTREFVAGTGAPW
jgi:thymidine phosphorylase